MSRHPGRSCSLARSISISIWMDDGNDACVQRFRASASSLDYRPGVVHHDQEEYVVFATGCEWRRHWWCSSTVALTGI